MLRFPSDVALKNIRKNPTAIWCANLPDTVGANESYAGNRIKKPNPPLRVAPKFALAQGQSVYAMGSCFAREIEAAFSRGGFDVLSFDYENFNPVDFAGPEIWSRSAFLNRYTTGSMLLEVERITARREVRVD